MINKHHNHIKSATLLQQKANNPILQYLTSYKQHKPFKLISTQTPIKQQPNNNQNKIPFTNPFLQHRNSKQEELPQQNYIIGNKRNYILKQTEVDVTNHIFKPFKPFKPQTPMSRQQNFFPTQSQIYIPILNQIQLKLQQQQSIQKKHQTQSRPNSALKIHNEMQSDDFEFPIRKMEKSKYKVKDLIKQNQQ